MFVTANTYPKTTSFFVAQTRENRKAQSKKHKDCFSGGMMMPNRNTEHDWSRMGYSGKTKDDEVYGKGNFVDYGLRSYMTQIMRFPSRDPLSSQFAMLSPYQYAGNNPIMAIDLDGAEPAKPEAGKRNLLVVVQGFTGDPDDGATQTKNAARTRLGLASDVNGLGALESLGQEYPDLQITTFASGGNSSRDIQQTITDFNSANPKGRVIAVGHSLGASQIAGLSTKNQDNPMFKVELFISIDAQGSGAFNTNTRVGANVWSTLLIIKKAFCRPEVMK